MVYCLHYGGTLQWCSHIKVSSVKVPEENKNFDISMLWSILFLAVYAN